MHTKKHENIDKNIKNLSAKLEKDIMLSYLKIVCTKC